MTVAARLIQTVRLGGRGAEQESEYQPRLVYPTASARGSGESVHVVYAIDHLAPGGAGRSITVLAPGLISAGVNLDVVGLSRCEPGLRDELDQAGAGALEWDAQNRISWIVRATRFLRDVRPDLVHTTLYKADVAGRRSPCSSGSRPNGFAG